jgi:hypothetical protein
MFSLKPEIVTALAAILGSLVGAFGSIVSNALTRKQQDRTALLAKKIARNEALYSDFINESARLLVDAAEHDVSDPHDLITAYAMLSRIRLSASPEVLKAAEHMLKHVVDLYSMPNLTAEQIRAAAINGQGPMRGFSDICRAELEDLQSRV